MIPDFGCWGRWSFVDGRQSSVVSGPRPTHTLIGKPQLCEHAPFRSEAASCLFATPGLYRTPSPHLFPLKY